MARGTVVCPRCGGTAVLDEDAAGRFFSCLACGWLKDVGLSAGVEDLRGMVPEEVWRRVEMLLSGEVER